MKRAVSTAVLLLGLALVERGAAAQEEAPPDETPIEEARAAPGDPILARYFAALAERRLVAIEAGSVEELRALVRTGQEAFLAGRYDDATLALYEVVESPRFADFAELEEVRGAELSLGSSLAELGATRTAARYLERAIARGPEGPFFAAAFRRHADLAFEGGAIEPVLRRLGEIAPDPAPPDATAELQYLRGHLALERGRLAEADAAFERVPAGSRMYPSAQYLRGVVATRRRSFEDAERHMCSVTRVAPRSAPGLVVDARYYDVRDLGFLALGRLAHELGRNEDAFAYYFGVPRDSDRVAEALFESAYTMYEGGDHDTALDLLDQLETRFGDSAFVAEASLLRGYVHLGRCQFEAAEQELVRYEERFGGMVQAIDAVLGDEDRRAHVYEALAREGAPAEVEGVMLALVDLDPVFHDLHAKIRTLDGELGRIGRIGHDVEALRARLAGGDAPQAAAPLDGFAADSAALGRDLAESRAAVDGLVEQVDALRAAGASRNDLRPVMTTLRTARTRLRELERRLRMARARDATSAPASSGDVAGASLDQLLRQEAARARSLAPRLASVRDRLVQAANEHAVRSIRELRERLASGVRRARIGRIDAVMGAKRRIEIEIQGLSAGRFPPELQSAVRVQRMLRENEEYWPFEGEAWPDEAIEPPAPDEDDE